MEVGDFVICKADYILPTGRVVRKGSILRIERIFGGGYVWAYGDRYDAEGREVVRDDVFTIGKAVLREV